ncbi:MAG TPA: glycoside hydrolase family 3 N-terminal domain-containing protein [Candidatus Limnocylindrales bacterium]|nr:glycoside hydrolase family 3 N-terminal domain-containing protein [Candidatus Limnocylindrales bacterium]
MDERSDPDRDVAPPSAISRRDVLRGAALGGVAVFVAACGSSTTPAPSTSPAGLATASPPPSPEPTAPSAPPTVGPSSAATTGPTVGLGHKIAGLMIVGFRGSELADAPWVRTALVESGLGGVILFDRDQLTGADRNVLSPAQVKRLTGDLRAAAPDRDIIVSVDQEGGIVTRLGPGHSFPAVASEATIGRGTAGAARTWARAIASTLAANGFNLNFAPVVDLDVNPDSPAIGALDRSFSADPDVVVARATIAIDEHRAAGVRTTLKHFPGIGSSTTNTDFGVADVTKTWTATELEPFAQLVAAGKADLVMAGHVVNGQFDADHPASLSPTIVTHVLRGQLGWDGIVVTDDLQAAAITTAFGRDEAILLAIEAGNDLLLFANQQVYDPKLVSRVVKLVAAAVASGRIPRSRIDEAYDRIQALFGGTTS